MRKINFGICGMGRIGVVHMRHFAAASEQYQPVAVCDRDVARAMATAAEYGCRAYHTLGEFLADPEMELVIIATRSLDHAANAVQALAAGKIVLVEKPIAVTTADYQMLVQADRDYPGKLYCLQNHRFEPAFESIRRVIDSGVLGDLQVVKLNRHHAFRRRADWQTLLDCGGGQLSCWGPHLIDQALQLIASPVKGVWSYLRRVVTPGDADDHLRIMITGENAVVAELEISNAVALPGPYCTVYGSRGSLICADEKHICLRYIDPAFELPSLVASADQPPATGGYGQDEVLPWIDTTVAVEPDTDMWTYVEERLVQHLYEAIREGIPFPVTNADALEVVRVTELVKSQNPQFSWRD